MINTEPLQLEILSYIYSVDERIIPKMQELKLSPNFFKFEYRPAIKALNAGEILESVGHVINYKDKMIVHDESHEWQKIDLLLTYKKFMKQLHQNNMITDEDLSEALMKRFEDKTITLQTAREIMETEGQQEFIISGPKGFGMFPPAGVSAIVGEPGGGKSYLCLDLCMKITQGHPWLKKYDTMKKNCLFIDEENGALRLKERLGVIGKDRMTGRVEIPENFYFLSFKGVNLLDPSWTKAIKRTIQDHDIGFVVVDSFVDVFTGDENSVKDVQPVMHAIRTLATETRSHFLLIHHTKKDGGGFRGSSAFNGAVDLMIEFIQQIPGDRKSGYKFHSTKSRDTVPFEKFIDMTIAGGLFGIEEKKIENK